MTYQFREATQPSYETAKRIVPVLLNLLGLPQSVVDLGGGGGGWCKAFKESGVKRIHCIDHVSVQANDLLIDEEEFIPCNFEVETPTLIKAELAMSIEFAEHISRKRSEAIVEFLTASAPIVLFSAAIPRQGGVGHINEQWPIFWRNLFAQKHYQMVDAIRPQILFDTEILPWVRQNLFLFVEQAQLETLPALKHCPPFLPNEFELVETGILSRPLGLREILLELPRALTRALSRRFPLDS
ncbi:MAG: hypothetical protein HY231_16085 [Acidobacteria bacterium]|nr:hypothetical protein [Acidobacteriota bacterium]